MVFQWGDSHGSMDFPLENPNLKWMKFICTPMKRTAPNSDTEKPGRFVMQHDDHSVFAPGHKNISTSIEQPADFRSWHLDSLLFTPKITGISSSIPKW